MPAVKEYETLYIVIPDLEDEALRKVTDAVADVAKKTGAEIIKNDVWGRRKLAYPIKKHQEGTYVLLRCKGGASIPKEIDTHIKRTPEIIRHLTTLVTKQQLKEEARQRALEAKRVEEAARREAEAAEEAARAEAEAAARDQAEQETPAQASEPAGETKAEETPVSGESSESATPSVAETTGSSPAGETDEPAARSGAESAAGGADTDSGGEEETSPVAAETSEQTQGQAPTEQ